MNGSSIKRYTEEGKRKEEDTSFEKEGEGYGSRHCYVL